MTRHTALSRRGFSLTEVMVVIGVIVALLGLLFPVIRSFRKSGEMTKSMAHLRQVATWLNLYAGDNRDHIVPSQFDYAPQPGQPPRYSGKVRSEILMEPVRIGRLHAGTWADILWTEFKLGVFPEAAAPWPQGFGHDYRYDSPGGLFYGQRIYADRPGLEFELDNPLRSAAANTRDAYSRMDLATPHGVGAGEKGLPGYFAANNFFNADPTATDIRTGLTIPAAWFTHGQIRAPERSMYLVDSFAGEVIQPWPERYKLPVLPDSRGDINDPTPDIAQDIQVDFRYSDLCLMLFLDGHSETQAKWRNIDELEGWTTEPDFLNARKASRGIKIRHLDLR